MAWDKIEDHLFERYCVEGEDAEFCRLMEEHDAEIRAQAITEFAEAVNKRIKEEVALLEKDREEAKMCDDEQVIFATNNQLRAFEYSLRVIAEQLRGGAE